jgi:hypothetical protein
MKEVLDTAKPAMSKFWSGDLNKIKARVADEAVYDCLFLPTKEYDGSEKRAVYDVLQRFIDDTVFQHGYTLSQTSRSRLGLYVASQVKAGVVIDEETLGVIFRRTCELNIYANDDGTEFNDNALRPEPKVKQPVAKPVESTEPTFDELLATTSGETREGRAKLREAAFREMVNGEYHATWSAFEASLYENFGGFVLTPKQRQAFYDTMIRRGMNFHRPKDYDRVRIALTQSGDLPPGLLYPQERLEFEMEMSNLNDREVRRQFAQRSRELATKPLI